MNQIGESFWHWYYAEQIETLLYCVQWWDYVHTYPIYRLPNGTYG